MLEINTITVNQKKILEWHSNDMFLNMIIKPYVKRQIGYSGIEDNDIMNPQ